MKEYKRVVKFQRKIGITQEYYRSTPELEVLDILNGYGINVPRILEFHNDCFIEEYIDGALLDDIYADYCNIDKLIIDDINTYLCFITMHSVLYYVKILYDCDYSEKLLVSFMLDYKNCVNIAN